MISDTDVLRSLLSLCPRRARSIAGAILVAAAACGADDEPAAAMGSSTGAMDTDPASETAGSSSDTDGTTTADESTQGPSETGAGAESSSSSGGDPPTGMRIVDLRRESNYVFAVADDGALYGWGQVPVSGNEELPLRFDAYPDTVRVATGALNVFVLRGDGTAVVFNGAQPGPAVPLEDIHAIETGDEGAHCAIAGADRQLYCWGFSAQGVLGFDPRENPEEPVLVDGMTGVAEVSVGGGHTCARMESGVVRCTGRGNDGQLGDGAFDSSRVGFEDVPGVGDFVSIRSTESSTCGLRAGGEFVCWGWTWHTGGIGSPTPPVAGIPLATGMLADEHMQCVWDEAGALSCWGYAPHGQVGNGETWTDMAQETPFLVEGIPPVAGGDAGTCIISDEGAVYCWGDNSVGQTGTGLPDSNVLTPTLVQL